MSRRAAVVALLVLAVGACTIGPQDEPAPLDVSIDDDALPLEVDVEGDGPLVDFSSSVYLISSDGELVPVTRDLASAPSVVARLRAVFDALADGPTDAEVESGLRSAIPATTDVLGVSFAGGTVTVDLSTSFTSIGGPTELRAVGQLVLTGTTFPGARDLVLRLDGVPTAIPLPDGALTDQPVSLRQFSDLLEPG